MKTEERENDIRVLYWQFIAVFFGFFALMVGIAFTGGRAGMAKAEKVSEDEAFVMSIEQIDPEDFTTIRTYDSLEDLITRGTPNLIVRVKFVSRGDCDVHDPFGQHSIRDLFVKTERTEGMIKKGLYYVWDDPDMEIHCAAASYICTPYEVEITDVLLGDLLREGDTFTFWAQYGIVQALKSWSLRYRDYPVFELEKEYVLFLSVSDISGYGREYELVTPAAAVKLWEEDERTLRSISPAQNRILNETGYDYDRLGELVKQYYTAAPYPLDAVAITPYVPADQ